MLNILVLHLVYFAMCPMLLVLLLHLGFWKGPTMICVVATLPLVSRQVMLALSV